MKPPGPKRIHATNATRRGKKKRRGKKENRVRLSKNRHL
jgi:hypothetical protein